MSAALAWGRVGFANWMGAFMEITNQCQEQNPIVVVVVPIPKITLLRWYWDSRKQTKSLGQNHWFGTMEIKPLHKSVKAVNQKVNVFYK
jgi:hypothetical protein